MRELKLIKIGDLTLSEILKAHQHWVYHDCERWENMRANLNYASLRYVDLCGANLYGASLYGADLRCANLYNADLSYADLSYANLSSVDLSCANLNGSNLYGANLYNAALRGTNLHNANLHGTILRDAKGQYIEYRKGKILTESIIGYKKCQDGVIVSLEIPKGAIVFSINGNKCRTNKAKVISIDGANRAYAFFKYMSYYVGDEITIYDFNCEYNVECGSGIHFFMTREEAEFY